MEELNSGPPKTNPSSGREEDLNPEPPDYKSSALTTRPHCLLEAAEVRPFPMEGSTDYKSSDLTTRPHCLLEAAEGRPFHWEGSTTLLCLGNGNRNNTIPKCKKRNSAFYVLNCCKKMFRIVRNSCSFSRPSSVR